MRKISKNRLFVIGLGFFIVSALYFVEESNNIQKRHASSVAYVKSNESGNKN